MAQSFDVCIRGAGIVGRTLALLLARERLRVALVNPAQPAAPEASDVRAYALNAASRTLLQSLRAWPDAEHATPVTRMEVQGDQGGAVQFDAATSPAAEALAWIVDVPALGARLADAVRFQPQVEVVDAPVAAPLTIISEGRGSATRAGVGVQFRAMAYPQHAIATRLVCELPHGQVARQWFSADGILAFLPLGGAQGREVAVVWSVAADRAAAWQALDAQAFARQLEDLSGRALGALVQHADRASWPLQRAVADRWCGSLVGAAGTAGAGSAPCWVLAGDAAHTVHPLAGQGLNLGLGDAAALARILRARGDWRSVGDLRLLRRYERERKAAIWPMGLATDGLQQLFARSETPLLMLRNWGMRGFDASGPLKAWVTRQAMGA